MKGKVAWDFTHQETRKPLFIQRSPLVILTPLCHSERSEESHKTPPHP